MSRVLRIAVAALVLTGCQGSLVAFKADASVTCGSGVTDCASVCVDLKTDAANCGACGKACAATESCVASACYPNDCLSGDCTATQVCVSSLCTDKSCVGVTCGAGLKCASGLCVSACQAGVACTTNPSAACARGVTTCAGTQVGCVDDAPLDAGASCGQNLVCDGDGGCRACTEGTSCGTNPNVCTRGQIACSSGQPVCTDTAATVDGGVSCGAGQVCSGSGACIACVEDAGCTTNPDPCRVGATTCSTGTPVCVNTSALSSTGTACGLNLVCLAGACVGCDAGTSCTPSNVCHRGLTSCTTGTQLCVDQDAGIANGTTCGTNQVCNEGSCSACTAGTACVPTDPCHLGQASCLTGVQTCVDLDAGAPQGTACGNLNVCLSGRCMTAQSCGQINGAYAGLDSGVFTISPDGVDGGLAFAAYCDMMAADGGWTLVWKTNSPTSTPATLFFNLYVGDGIPGLLDEVQTPDYEKHVMLDIPTFDKIMIRSTNREYVVDAGTKANNEWIRTSWKSFFGPDAGSNVNVNSQPVTNENPSVCSIDAGVYRQNQNFVYSMQNIKVCMRNADGTFAILNIGDRGCGVSQCYRMYHEIFGVAPSATSYYYTDSSAGTNTNVRIFVK